MNYLEAARHIRHEYWPNNAFAPYVSIDLAGVVRGYVSPEARDKADEKRRNLSNEGVGMERR